MAEKTTTVFDQFFGMSEKDFSAEQKQIVKNKIKRQFESSFDNAKDVIISLEEKIKNLYANNFSSFDVNNYRKLAQEKKAYEEAMKQVADLHVEFFGEEIRK